MTAITVDTQGLLEDFKNWGVRDEYAQWFMDRNKIIAGKIELSDFAINVDIKKTDPAQWICVYAAFWCRFYREAKNHYEQSQALGAIQSLYYIAGMLRLGNQAFMIHRWWNIAFPLHDMEAPNMQFVPVRNIKAVH